MRKIRKTKQMVLVPAFFKLSLAVNGNLLMWRSLGSQSRARRYLFPSLLVSLKHSEFYAQQEKKKRKKLPFVAEIASQNSILSRKMLVAGLTCLLISSSTYMNWDVCLRRFGQNRSKRPFTVGEIFPVLQTMQPISFSKHHQSNARSDQFQDEEIIKTIFTMAKAIHCWSSGLLLVDASCHQV